MILKAGRLGATLFGLLSQRCIARGPMTLLSLFSSNGPRVGSKLAMALALTPKCIIP